MSKIKRTSIIVKRLKRLAPIVPDPTCPDIDFIVDKVDNSTKPFTRARRKTIVRKLERLRIQNEHLRELGKYWYRKFKDYVPE